MKDEPNQPEVSDKTEKIEKELEELSDLIKAEMPEPSATEAIEKLHEIERELSVSDGKLPVVTVTPPRRRRRWLAIVVLFFLLIAGGAGAAYLWAKKQLNTPVVHDENKLVTVEQGAGTQAVIAKLTQAGIVRQPRLLTLYLRVLGRTGNLKPGTYKFDSPITPLQAIEKIERGEVAFERVTIPEGFDRFDISKLLAKKTGKASEEEFLLLMNNTRLIANIAPEARNLEGYLFPDTYNYTEKTTPEELIQMMVNRFKEVYTPESIARASQLGFSTHKLITIASIIEKEAKVEEDRPKIASVIYNRLKHGMPLACDPTFIYAAKLEGDYDGNPNQPRHRQRQSPYNTYLFAGIPPGPIASPGKSSLQAALYPADTKYLYFVVNGTEGHHKFSETPSEHAAAVAEYRKQQQEQREK